MKPRAGDRSETPLLPALLPLLLFHPSRRLPPSDSSSSRQTKKRQRARRRTALFSPFPSSHGGSHRLINQTSVNKSLRRSHGGSRRSSYSSFSPSSTAFTPLALLASLLHDFYRRPPTRARFLTLVVYPHWDHETFLVRNSGFARLS